VDPTSVVHDDAIRLLLVRLEDWLPERTAEGDRARPSVVDITELDVISARAEEFTAHLGAAARRACHTIVAICPSGALSERTDAQQRIMAIEKAFTEGLETLANVRVIGSSALIAEYGISAYYDRDADQLGHIPYTPPFFLSLATSLVRAALAAQRPPYKVL